MARQVFDEPSECFAEEGVVIIDGPDGLAAAFSVEAALKTSERLMEAAMTARGQSSVRRQLDGEPQG